MLTTLFNRARAIHLSSNQMRRRYSVALSLLAFMTIASQIVIQVLIADRVHDSHIVNIAGRQRMLSQTIAKTSAFLVRSESLDEESHLRGQLDQSLGQWERAHRGLLQGDPEWGLPGNNSNAVMALFAHVELPYAAIVSAAKLMRVSSVQSEEFKKSVDSIQQHQSSFLKAMEDIVLLYDREAREKLAFARWLEFGFMGITLVVLMLEAAFIFAPATRRMEHDMQQLANREEDLESLFAVSPTAILLVDSHKLSILHANQKAAALIGLPNSEIIKGTLHDHLDDQYDANRRFLEKLTHRGALNDFEVVRFDGRRSVFETLVSIRPIVFSNRPALVIGITSAAELKKAQETLEFFASFDEVSRLMNRHVGLLMLEKSMERSKRNGEVVTVCFADLAGLMSVNDRYGRAEGDWLIHTLARVLTELIEPDDIAIRLGGDEFLLVLHNCSPDAGDFLMVCADERLAEIEAREKKPFQLSISFGTVAYVPTKHATAGDLIAGADAQMCKAKQEKKQRLQRPHGNTPRD
jgi:diguanylate cyclase (GGDEF)-like protein/PAS domain S-box-containing protein